MISHKQLAACLLTVSMYITLQQESHILEITALEWHFVQGTEQQQQQHLAKYRLTFGSLEQLSFLMKMSLSTLVASWSLSVLITAEWVLRQDKMKWRKQRTDHSTIRHLWNNDLYGIPRWKGVPFRCGSAGDQLRLQEAAHVALPGAHRSSIAGAALCSCLEGEPNKAPALQ